MVKPLPVLLMTRPQAASERFADTLRARGLRFHAIISPLMRIEVTGPLPDLSGVKGVVFTSANGVAAWVSLGGGSDLPAYAVGAATARAARQAGMQADSADGNVDDLRDWLLARKPASPLVHVHGQHVRGDLALDLTKAGLPCGATVIYDQVAQPLTDQALAALAKEAPVIVPVFSPRTGELLVNAQINAPLLVAAMSEAVVKSLGALHKQELKVAQRPESEAMLEVVSDLLSGALVGDF